MGAYRLAAIVPRAAATAVQVANFFVCQYALWYLASRFTCASCLLSVEFLHIRQSICKIRLLFVVDWVGRRNVL